MSPELTLDQLEQELFFIVGCPRSGTTLLQMAIGNHPEIVMPHETGFYSLLWKRNKRRLGELGDAVSFKAGFDAAMSFWRIREMKLDPDEVWHRCRAGEQDWETLFLAILGTFADRAGKARIGEKSAGHVYLLSELGARFPHAKFLHIVRDPRAVVLSHYQAFGGFTAGLGRRWKRAIAAHLEQAPTLGPDRYRMVRYEDLVSRPEETIRHVSDFLDLSFFDSMVNQHKREHRGFAERSSGHMENVNRPIFRSSIDRWKSELTSVQVAVIEHLLGEEMRLMGYSPRGTRVPLVSLRCGVDTALDFVHRGVHRGRISIGLQQEGESRTRKSPDNPNDPTAR
jgi:hypothetical protein